ncbi:MAG: SdpI family protein [Flavipsychrobacter sp.]
MASKNFLKHFPILLISILPFGYLLAIWNSLPEKIAIHYNMKGEVDRYGSSLELVFVTLLLTVIGIGTYILLTNIHKIDPKRAKSVQVNTYNKIASGIVLFTSIINLVIIINGANPESSIANKVVLPSIGFLFMFLGNYMYTIKPNHFVGIRVPWTLESDTNWKKTHQLGGKLFFLGGLTITIVALVAPFQVASIVMLIIITVISIAAVYYSYSIFKSESKSKNI